MSFVDKVYISIEFNKGKTGANVKNIFDVGKKLQSFLQKLFFIKERLSKKNTFA